MVYLKQIAAGVCVAAVVSPLLAQSTVAHWRFNDGSVGDTATGTHSVLDADGNDHPGTPFGGPIYAESFDGQGTCLYFDGVNDRVFIEDHADFELTDAFTIEASVWIQSLPRNVRVVFRGDERSGTDPYSLFLLSTGQPVIAFHDGVRNNTLVGPDNLTLNTWHNLGGTFDSNRDLLSLYVDGHLVASSHTTTKPFGELTGPLPGLGIANVQSGNFNEYFHGYIDEVRISSASLSPEDFLFPPCRADVNNDGSVDTNDVMAFLNAWVQQDQVADWNGDGVVNTRDFMAFLNDWVVGC